MVQDDTADEPLADDPDVVADDPRVGSEADAEVDRPSDAAHGSDGPRRRPPPLRPAAILLVFLGGTVGTGLRAGLTAFGSRALATPYVTVVINLVGAFALGLLLESLARAGPDHGRRQRLRLLLGTGLLGGFTTYSSLAVDVATLGGRGQLGAAVLVALGTLLLGAVATALGILAGSRWSGPRVGEPA